MNFFFQTEVQNHDWTKLPYCITATFVTIQPVVCCSVLWPEETAGNALS